MVCILDFLASKELRGIISILTLIFGVVGGAFALKRWRKTMRLSRAEYVNKLLDEMRSVKDLCFYLFEYDEKWYDINFHNSGELERKVDTTLDFYSYICYLKDNKIITDSDFNFFKYDVERIIMNRQFQYYCYNLYHFSSKLNLPMSFYSLFMYAKQKHKFDKDFWDSTSENYPHYLISRWK